MNDMASVIVPKSDQINADDLISGTMTVTIRSVKIAGGQEQPVSMALEGMDKVFRPCKIMCRLIVRMWGGDHQNYAGRSMTLYRDPTVKWGALTVGGIRISHMSHIDGETTVVLQEKRGQLKPHTIKPLKAQVHQHPAQNEDAAAGWADRYIAALKNALDMEELAELRAKHGPRIAEMKAKRPDLYQRVITEDSASEITQPPAAGAEVTDDAGNLSGDMQGVSSEQPGEVA